LSQEKYLDVQNRASKTLEWGEKGQWLLEIALDHLSLGRSYMLQALEKGTHNFIQASTHLNQAVLGLQKAGNKHYLPRGLLARAELYMEQKDFEKAMRDLDEAMTIAERGEMGLHKADCHLGYARLYLVIVDKEKAREELAVAKEMIGKMGYHRRDGEVKELEALL
jgi:tetratricopeptide (TPR) repeat protein